MCGIIGCTGPRLSVRVLIEGLHALEYRGYDSAGVCYCDPERRLVTVKCGGRIRALEEALGARLDAPVSAGIGHTRWATHGAPTGENAHPHGTARLQLVHNGILENFRALHHELAAAGCTFSSQTDTECAALLLDRLYNGDPVSAIRAAAERFEGAYAMAMLFADRPGELYAIRHGSPLLLGVCRDALMIASDLTALLPHTRRYAVIPEDTVLMMSGTSYRLIAPDGTTLSVPLLQVDFSEQAAARGGFSTFMEKEIHEEPDLLQRLPVGRMRDGIPDFSPEGLNMERLAQAEHIYIVACGTALHAGLLAAARIEEYARIPVITDIASEFRYRNPVLSARDAVLLISQSGETADTVAALRLAREKGAYTIGVVNAVGSTVAREADCVLYTHAGPEIAVASTKAYTAQVALLSLFTLALAEHRGTLCASDIRRITEQFPDAVASVRDVLTRSREIVALAETVASHGHLFFIGRLTDYPLALEASLKLKEISYLHSEAYAAGELKHGTISLIEPGTPVIMLSLCGQVRPKLISNGEETRARGAALLAFTDHSGDEAFSHLPHFTLAPCDPFWAPVAMPTALQLFALSVALRRGLDPDRPRNLAKSVTVE